MRKTVKLAAAAAVVVSVILPAAALAQRSAGSRWGVNPNQSRTYSGNVDLPDRKIDTAGKGDFYGGLGGSETVRRAYFDPRNQGRIEVGYGDERNFRIVFYGVVMEQHSDRRFTIRLVDSERGRANGTAEVKLNRDRNEVEAMMMSGDVGGTRFAGDFRRNE